MPNQLTIETLKESCIEDKGIILYCYDPTNKEYVSPKEHKNQESLQYLYLTQVLEPYLVESSKNNRTTQKRYYYDNDTNALVEESSSKDKTCTISYATVSNRLRNSLGREKPKKQYSRVSPFYEGIHVVSTAAQIHDKPGHWSFFPPWKSPAGPRSFQFPTGHFSRSRFILAQDLGGLPQS